MHSSRGPWPALPARSAALLGGNGWRQGCVLLLRLLLLLLAGPWLFWWAATSNGNAWPRPAPFLLAPLLLPSLLSLPLLFLHCAWLFLHSHRSGQQARPLCFTGQSQANSGRTWQRLSQSFPESLSSVTNCSRRSEAFPEDLGIIVTSNSPGGGSAKPPWRAHHCGGHSGQRAAELLACSRLL